jgi:hypothetical protein
MLPLVFLSILAAVLIVGLVLLGARRRLGSGKSARLAARARRSCPPQRYDTAAAAGSYAITAVDVVASVHPTSALFADQPGSWRAAMTTLGDRLASARVDEVTFVHGTFVGTDPFSMLSALRGLNRSLDPAVTDRVGRLLKHGSDWLTRDHGNFEAPYVDLFREAVGRPASLLLWSSENSHAARLQAAARLAHHLVDRLDHGATGAPRRVLLVGHSHAGQVFALLLQMIHACEHAPELLRIAGELGEDRDWLSLHIERLRRVSVDVVTFGSPPRYGWPSEARDRILHIVNHRGASPLAGRLDGVLSTRDGDYVQQWGIAGSDIPASSARVRGLNRELDAILGPGHAPSTWLEQLEHRKRVHEGGFTLLVDYGDAATRGVNCLHTNFGHAIYTKRRMMHFWVREVVRRFY